MKVCIRNLTKNVDKEIKLPMDERKLDEILNTNDEYIVINSEILDVDEYASIDRLNKFLLDCKENGISLTDLEVLSKVMYYNEVIDAVENGTYTIIDFDSETFNWNCGNGGNFHNDYDKGMCLYHSVGYKPFNFKVTKDNHDWIDWECVWINANTENWQAVTIDDGNYLVHR